MTGDTNVKGQIKEPKMLSLDAFSRAQMRLTAGLHPDPLRELERSPQTPDPQPQLRDGRMGPISNGERGKGRGEKGG